MGQIHREVLPALLAVALTIPQAIAFSLMAGVNPEYGLSLCIIPTLTALLLSRSPYLLSGPNTAVSLLLFSATLPYAVPYSAGWHGIVLVITGFAALFQLLFCVFRFGRVFMALPMPVVHAIISGTGLLIILSQLGMAVGIAPNGIGIYENIGQALLTDKINVFAVAVTAVTVAGGLLARKSRYPGIAIVYGAVQGVIFSEICRIVFGDQITNVPLLGNTGFPSTWLVMPQMEWDNLVLWQDVIKAGFAVAVIGALQAVIVALSLAQSTRSSPSLDREILAQSGMNFAALITGSFAGAASFNRSMSNLQAGGTGKVPGFLSVALIALFVFSAGGLLRNTPLAVVAGTLILSGWTLLKSVNWRDFRSTGHYAMFGGTYVCVVFVDLVSAVLIGAVIAVYCYVTTNDVRPAASANAGEAAA